MSALYRPAKPVSDAKLIAAMIRTLDPKSGRGPGWYTNGQAGMWSQVRMWISKAAQSRADLAPLLAMEGGE